MRRLGRSKSTWIPAYVAWVLFTMSSTTNVSAECGEEDSCPMICFGSCSCNEYLPYWVQCTFGSNGCSDTGGWARRVPYVVYGYDDPPPGFFCPTQSTCAYGYFTYCAAQGRRKRRCSSISMLGRNRLRPRRGSDSFSLL